MKLCGYILAFYLIILSSVPCCAVDNCPDDKIDLSAGAEDPSNHENGEEDCGNCSPFFNCEGCATATIAFEPLSIEITAITELSIYADYLQYSVPKVDYDFWQPPKLS